MQLDLAGGAPRMIAEDVPRANAFEVGPDGKLYFPVMGANQIWRVDLARGSPEVVAAGFCACGRAARSRPWPKGSVGPKVCACLKAS